MRAFYYLDSGVQLHDSVISAKGHGILLIFGADFPISQVHQSDLQLHPHPQPAVFFVFLQVRIVNHVVIYDIRSGIVASAGFIVQIIIESLFVDPGTAPEFSLSSVLLLFVSSDGLQYRISVPQIEKIIENHGQDHAVKEYLAHIIAIEGPGGVQDP